MEVGKGPSRELWATAGSLARAVENQMWTEVERMREGRRQGRKVMVWVWLECGTHR